MDAEKISLRNVVLGQLDEPLQTIVMPALERIDYVAGDILADMDTPLSHVHFPDSGVISVIATYANGDAIETATIGREGLVGIEGALGGQGANARYVVQVRGGGQRMRREKLNELMDAAPDFRSLIFRYVQAFISQLLISGACNGRHAVQSRLARWLLTMHDRNDGDALPLTHSFLADMLGAYRPTVSLALAQLQGAGVIETRRALIVIRDRAGLEALSCECYGLSRDSYARVLRERA